MQVSLGTHRYVRMRSHVVVKKQYSIRVIIVINSYHDEYNLGGFVITIIDILRSFRFLRALEGAGGRGAAVRIYIIS